MVEKPATVELALRNEEFSLSHVGMTQPTDIQLIGDQIAIRWSDGSETFYTQVHLRKNSPSAAARGEPDIFGNIHGGEGERDFSDVTVVGWEYVGNYAIRFRFSDGHQTGLYSYELLRQLNDSGGS